MADRKESLQTIIHTRRSTRKYKPDPLPKELLDEIIEAGRMAPSGNNNQSTHFIAITDPARLAELREVMTGVLAHIPVKEGMPPPLVGLINKAKRETVDVGYGAPALVLAANKKEYYNAMADCSCALENIMLMANACGVGSCWINQYYLLREAPPIRAFMERLGLKEDEEVCGAVVLGYADQPQTTPLPRTGNPVTYA